MLMPMSTVVYLQEEQIATTETLLLIQEQKKLVEME